MQSQNRPVGESSQSTNSGTSSESVSIQVENVSLNDILLRDNAPPVPTKPRPTISYSLEDGNYRASTRPSVIGAPPPINFQSSNSNSRPSLKGPSLSLSLFNDDLNVGGHTKPSMSGIKTTFMKWDQESPEFLENLQILKSHCTRFSNRLHRDNAALGKEQLCNVPHQQKHYIDTLTSVTVNPGIPELDGTSIMHVISQTTELRNELKSKLEKAGKLEEALFDSMKCIHDQSTRYEEQKARHIEKTKNFQQLKANGDAKKIYEKSIKLNTNEQYLELERYSLYSELNQIDANMEQTLLRPLQDRLSALYDFFTAGAQLLAPYKKLVDNLEKRTTVLETEKEALQAAFASSRQGVEMESGLVFKESPPTDSGISGLLGIGKKDAAVSGSTGIRDLDIVSKVVGKSKNSGYLFLPNKDNDRVWVEIGEKDIFISKGKPEAQSLPLVLCTVKQARDTKQRYSFQVITPQTSIQFQAESEQSMLLWLEAIQAGIGKCLDCSEVNRPETARHGDDKNSAAAVITDMLTKRLSVIAPMDANKTSKMLQGPNSVCADCGEQGPTWISLSLGCTICLECSAVHRQLGVGISKVRSATMDYVDKFYQSFIETTGNNVLNSVYMEVPPTEEAIHPQTPRAQRAEFLIRKYNRAFLCMDKLSKGIEPGPLPTDPLQRLDALNARLVVNIQHGDVTGVLECLVKGADVDTVIPDNEERSSVHEAFMYANPTICVMVALRSTDQSLCDERGWTCLHYAAYANKPMLTDVGISLGGSMLAMQRDLLNNQTPREVAENCNTDEDFALEQPLVISALKRAEEKYLLKQQKLE